MSSEDKLRDLTTKYFNGEINKFVFEYERWKIIYE